MTREEREIYNRALYEFGISKQVIMVCEECAELINVLTKTFRARLTRDDVITELADVSIMVEQLAFFFGEDLFVAEKNRKLKRLKERLNNPTEE